MTKHLGDYFRNSTERGWHGLPVLSVTLTNGIVDRESLDRKMETELDASQHLLVRPGDIAYNMMRMWQGALGVADREGLVSPAYIVARPRGNLDSRFAGYFLKSDRMLHRLWSFSYGLTSDRLRLYYKDFAAIPAQLPPLPEQRRKKALMQQLLTGKKRFAEFEGQEWKRMEFSDFVELKKVKVDPHTADPGMQCIELEHIAQGSGIQLGWTPLGKQASLKNGFTDVLFGKLRPNLRKYLMPNRPGACSSEIWVLRPALNVCAREFLFYLIQSGEFIQMACATCGSKMPRADWTWVSEHPFSLPGVAEQRKIAAVLNTADEEVVQLKNQLAALRRQKQGLMQVLLTGKVRVKVEEGKYNA